MKFVFIHLLSSLLFLNLALAQNQESEEIQVGDILSIEQSLKLNVDPVKSYVSISLFNGEGSEIRAGEDYNCKLALDSKLINQLLESYQSSKKKISSVFLSKQNLRVESVHSDYETYSLVRLTSHSGLKFNLSCYKVDDPQSIMPKFDIKLSTINKACGKLCSVKQMNIKAFRISEGNIIL